MTVKELKEKLNEFDDNIIVMIPDDYSPIGYTPSTHIAKGVNEADGCVFLTDYEEMEGCVEEDSSTCSGCIYEYAEPTTDAVSNCVCCSRNVPFAKNDNYRKKIKT